MPKERLPINVLDPKDVAAKMPQIKELLAAKREELEALTEQVAFLERVVGPAVAPERRAKRSLPAGSLVKVRNQKIAPAQDRAVQALEKAGRPMGPTSLYNFMVEQGMDLPDNANALGANLWAAAKAGRIVKTPNGVYAALGAPTDRPLTDYDAAAENGFPVPSAGHGLGGEP